MNSVSDFLSGLQYTQELCEILLNRCKVHLVQTNEERNIREHHCLNKELDEVGVLIFLADMAIVAKQFRRVVPIRFHLNHAVVTRGGTINIA